MNEPINKGHSVDPKIVDWSMTIEKRQNDLAVRHLLIPTLSSDRTFKMLSFPAGGAIMETSLIQDLPELQVEITGIERDPMIFRQLEDTAQWFEEEYSRARFSLGHGPCDLQRYLDGREKATQPEEQFDFIYPDYMGTWSQEKRHNMVTVFEKNLLRVGGLLTLTIMAAREYPKTKEELEAFSESSFSSVIILPDNRTDGMIIKSQGLAGLLCNLAEQYGQTLEPRAINFFSSPARTGDTPHVNTAISLTFQKII
jgi:hypothetical protein